jgi:uncharacterized membrane protein
MEQLKHMPSGRQAAIHFAVMAAVSGIVGPLLGPVIVNYVNPPTAWGIMTKIGDYSPGNILLWGAGTMMFVVFFYTGWLLAQGRRDWKKAQPKAWYN